MADDRIDEAIAAVVRAVDRIDAAARGETAPTPPADPGRLPRKPPPPAFTATDLRPGGFASRPATSLGAPPVDPDVFDEPEIVPSVRDDLAAAAYDPHSYDEPSPDLWPEETFYEPEPAFEAPVPPVEPPAPEPVAAAPAPPAPPAPPASAPAPSPARSPAPPATPPLPSYDALNPTGEDDLADAHELIGRILARTQHLDDQLEAARYLRFEITELVRRLAAAVEREN